MPQLGKSNKDAFGDIFLMIPTSCLEKPSQTTLRLSHIYHSPVGCSFSFFGYGSLNGSACTKPGGGTLQLDGRTQYLSKETVENFSNFLGIDDLY
jgi:hypothetical protein